LRCRAVGTCFSQHTTEQNLSFMRPVLHDATVQRTAEAPGGINLRHVAQTRLAMQRGSTPREPCTPRAHFHKHRTAITVAREGGLSEA
jgi:hypothetical protein